MTRREGARRARDSSAGGRCERQDGAILRQGSLFRRIGQHGKEIGMVENALDGQGWKSSTRHGLALGSRTIEPRGRCFRGCNAERTVAMWLLATLATNAAPSSLLILLELARDSNPRSQTWQGCAPPPSYARLPWPAEPNKKPLVALRGPSSARTCAKSFASCSDCAERTGFRFETEHVCRAFRGTERGTDDPLAPAIAPIRGSCR